MATPKSKTYRARLPCCRVRVTHAVSPGTSRLLSVIFLCRQATPIWAWAQELKHDGHRLQSTFPTVWLGLDGVADVDALHNRVNDRAAVALAFVLALDGDDPRRKLFSERKQHCGKS